jgi:hypothetical protein
MLGINSVPSNLKKSCENTLRNLLSRSLTMYFNNPWSLNTFLKNNSAIGFFMYYEDMEKKCEKFVNRSTTTYMQSLFHTFGRPVMKSMYTLSHFFSRMGKVCNKVFYIPSNLNGI